MSAEIKLLQSCLIRVHTVQHSLTTLWAQYKAIKWACWNFRINMVTVFTLSIRTPQLLTIHVPKIWTSTIHYPMLCLKIAGWVANSVDPDETPRSAASHLGLYCLLRPVCPNTYGKYGRCPNIQVKYEMMCKARKGPLCNLQTTKALISLRICTGWSGPSLSAYWINGYCSICQRTENVQIRQHRCVHFSGSPLFAYGIRALFLLCASYNL